MADDPEVEGTLLRGVKGHQRGKLYFISHDDLAEHEVTGTEKAKAEKLIKRFAQEDAIKFSEVHVYSSANVIKRNIAFHACGGQETDSE